MQQKNIKKHSRHKRDLTSGKIAAHIWFLSLPIIITNLLQTVFNVVDMFWVGKLGPAAIAAVAMSGTILLIVMFVMLGIGTGTTAMIARFIGAKRYADADNTAMQSITLGAVISLILSAIGFIISPVLFKILGAGPEVISLGVGYLRIMFCGIFIMFFMFLISAIFQGAGDVITPMIVLAIATILNIILDPLFIFGISFFPRLGINGAAVATVISRLVGSVIALEILLKGRSVVHVRLSEYRLDFSILWRIIKIGVPSSAQMSLRGLMNVFIMSFVAAFGTFAVAAYGICIRLEMFVIMPGFGFAGAAATMVGQNLGANNAHRAERSSWFAAFYYMVFMVIMSFIFFAFAPFLIRLFSASDIVIGIGTGYLRIVSLSFIFIAVAMTLNRSLVGAGDTLSAMLITFIALWGVLVPLAYVLSRYTPLGLKGIWIAMVVSIIFQALMNIFYFRTGRWRTKKV